MVNFSTDNVRKAVNFTVNELHGKIDDTLGFATRVSILECLVVSSRAYIVKTQNNSFKCFEYYTDACGYAEDNTVIDAYEIERRGIIFNVCDIIELL